MSFADAPLAIMSYRLPDVDKQKGKLAASTGGLVTGLMGFIGGAQGIQNVDSGADPFSFVAQNQNSSCLVAGTPRIVWYGANETTDSTAAGMTDRTHETKLKDGVDLVSAILTPEEHYALYDYVSNGVLWQLSHNQPQNVTRLPPEESTRLFDMAEEAVGTLADQFVDHCLKPGHRVWVQDYHFLTMGEKLRDRGVENELYFFLHIPVIEPEVLKKEDPIIKERMLAHYEALFSYDRVGFQTKKDLENFARLMDMKDSIPKDLEKGEEVLLERNGKKCRFQYCPIGIDVDLMIRMGQDNAVPLIVRPEPKPGTFRTEEEREKKIEGLMAEKAKVFSLYDEVHVPTPQLLKEFARVAGLKGDIPENIPAGEPLTLRQGGRTIHMAHVAGMEEIPVPPENPDRLPRVLSSARADPAKLFSATLDGVEEALEQGLRFEFNLVAYPNRTSLKVYQDTYADIVEKTAKINAKHGTPDFQPVQHITTTVPHSQVVGAYRAADICLVLSERDGMNLVAKEYNGAQNSENPGVLIIARNVGTAEELAKTDAAIIVENPHDRKEIAAAIKRALSMSREERIAMHQRAIAVHRDFDAARWTAVSTKPIREPANQNVPESKEWHLSAAPVPVNETGNLFDTSSGRPWNWPIPPMPENTGSNPSYPTLSAFTAAACCQTGGVDAPISTPVPPAPARRSDPPPSKPHNLKI